MGPDGKFGERRGSRFVLEGVDCHGK
jgi:hypothetical protein